MSYPKIEHLLREYFADDLSTAARQEIERQLAATDEGRQALEELLATRSELLSWQDERVPHWDRGMELYRREHRSAEKPSRWSLSWQWLPTAASFAMLALVFVNTSVVAGADGLRISFGAPAADASVASVEASLRADIDALVARIETRQDANNLQLMQVVMEQTQQTTASNLDRIYSFFEQQRVRDLEAMRVSLQELVDSDYLTMRSIQQLAQHVSYDGSIQ